MLTSHTRLRFVPLSRKARAHELGTQRRIAGQLAELLGCRFEGDLDSDAPLGEPAYLVPNDTVTSLDAAACLGIRSAADFFGGVVPAPFVATKTISHPLVGAGAAAPAGWVADFADRVREAVLPGLSAFSLDDARAGGRRLLLDGPVRLKPAGATGGAGQRVVRDPAELDARLEAMQAAGGLDGGVVLERDLEDARTFSVGLLQLGAMRASYIGTQRTTANRHGQAVYGGSSITVVRGGLDELQRLAQRDAEWRAAVALVRTYHEAALACFDGLLASRCNYDVIQGRAGGRTLTGVLEQSWRIGGATGAEVVALRALRDDPALGVVRASTVEVHGPLSATPAGAVVYYADVDPDVGPITKYAVRDDHADPRAEG